MNIWYEPSEITTPDNNENVILIISDGWVPVAQEVKATYKTNLGFVGESLTGKRDYKLIAWRTLNNSEK